MARCDYYKCEKEATTKGFVWTLKQKEDPSKLMSHTPVDVNACDEHKKANSFFEYIAIK